MSEQSTHIGPNEGDPADRGGQIGSGLVPDEVVEGAAEVQAAQGQPQEGLVPPGGVDAERAADQ